MASHRHHSSRSTQERERIQPLHMTPSSQVHTTSHPIMSSHQPPQPQPPQPPQPPPPSSSSSMPHSNGILHHSSIPHSSHPSPAMSNGHTHPQQLPGQLISPSQSAHPNATPVMGHVNGHSPAIQKLAKANEETWLLIGEVAEQMSNLDFALTAYEHALRHNPRCVPALSQVAGIARIKENYPKAIDYFQRVVSLPGHEMNGEVWSALGHCYLMQDDLQKAYSAYQQALYHLPNPKDDPKLWYGIGILYDRYGSLDHAEEAFASVLRMDKNFDKANEILFRLGIIYKQQGKYENSLECFDRILRSPPSPLAHVDIWFQIGHVYEQQKDYVRAKDAYERVVAENPGHAKVLQQLGWLYHQQGAPFQNQELAIQYLTKSLEADPSDAQSWYLLGRAYMAGQKYNKAYEAYQQAVYRDGRNPTFWCSIGVLYFQINQYRDALDAYSRAIRINPYISEVWFDLGSLYESCNNQISDAIDAYGRAAELDPYNPHIKQRLDLLKNVQENGGQLPTAPGPQDVHPTAYATAAGPPGIPGPGAQPMMPGGPGHPGSHGGRLLFRSDSRGSNEHTSLPAPAPPSSARHNSPGPFRGGPPPPVVLDESRRPPQHTHLAPMEVDRPPASAGEGGFPSSHAPSGGLLLQHPHAPQGPPGRSSSSNEYIGPRRDSRSVSPPPPRAPSPHYTSSGYRDQRSYNATSPRGYVPHDSATIPLSPGTHERHRDRLRDDRGKDRDRSAHEREHSGRDTYNSQQSNGSRYPYDATRSARDTPRGAATFNGRSSPPSWDPTASSQRRQSSNTLPTIENRGGSPHPVEQPSRRYDPIRGPSQIERPQERKIDLSSESYRSGLKGAPSHMARQTSESPQGEQRKKSRSHREKDRDGDLAGEGKKERRKKNGNTPKRQKGEPTESSRAQVSLYPEQSSATSSRAAAVSNSSDDKSVSSQGSLQKPPSPVAPVPRVATRLVDEDYDEDVTDALMGLATQRPPDTNTGRRSAASSHLEQRNSPPSTNSYERDSVMRSPPPSGGGASSLKRPLSPIGVDNKDAKRSRTDLRGSPSSPRQVSPSAVSRPSPIPFRVQASPEIFRSAEMDKERSSAEVSSRDSHSPPSHNAQGSPPPPPPPPHHRRTSSHTSETQGTITLPPIATISPRPTSPSPSEEASNQDVKVERKNFGLIDHPSPQVSTPRSASTSKRASIPPADTAVSSPPASP